MSSCQSHHQLKLGSASVNIKKAVAGRATDCTLTYRVGEPGIADGGALKILFRISSDVPDVQFSHKNKPNYVHLSSNKSGVKLSGYSRSNGPLGRIHTRPWTNGFIILVKGSCLSAGDWIRIAFKDWRIQTFLEATFEYKILVDPFTTGKYLELPNSPEIKIVPDQPAKLVIATPTTVVPQKKFLFLIKIEDKWGNPCVNKKGVFKVVNFQEIGLGSGKVPFNQGKALVKGALPKSEKTFSIRAEFKGLVALSNPITVVDQKVDKHLWADLHWQSEETCGTNSLEDNLDFAKNYALLDVVSPQGNDFQIEKKFWQEIQSLAKKKTKKGSLLVFPGYEWSGETKKGGDRNIIFLGKGNDLPIYRSSHALVEDLSDIDTDCPRVEDLFPLIKKQKALMIAHVGGRQANLEMHDEDVERLVEVHSDWGTFECFLFEALDRGYKVGIVANSDNHNGRPGASYPGLEEFNCYGGLTCILAQKLDKTCVFESLYSRHCYATTGARIFIDLSCRYWYEDQGRLAVMGEELPAGAEIQEIFIEVKGTSQIEKVEIFNKSRIIYTYHRPVPNESKYLKVAWSRYAPSGRDRKYKWNGKISFIDTRIKNIATVNIYHHTNLRYAPKSCWYESFTTGNTQGLIFELSQNSGLGKVEINGVTQEIDISAISYLPVVWKLGDGKARVEIYKVDKDISPDVVKLTYKLRETDLEKNNAFFVKITQRDGHLAWTTPLYLESPGLSRHKF